MSNISAPQPPSYGPPPSAVYPQAPLPVAQRPKTPLRDLVFGWRGALAVLIAGLIVGGLAGAAIALIVDHAGNGGQQRPTITLPGGSGSGFGGFGYGGGYGGSGAQGGQGGSEGSNGSGAAPGGTIG